MTVVGTAKKQPNEVQDYDIDFSQWLADGDTVASVLVFCEPVLPVDPIAAISPDGRVVKVWVDAGGVSGASHQITVRATTSGGRKKEAELRLRLKEI